MFHRKIYFCLILTTCLAFSACSQDENRSEEHYRQKRLEMVANQLKSRGIYDPAVLEVMAKVPRHKFVPQRYLSQAYADHPLPIGYSQTISQPYIVAFMTQALKLKGGETVLEIGAGSGYQAAVLAELCSLVCSIEIVPELAETATLRLMRLGYDNVRVLAGDGYLGWPDTTIKFDRVILTAAPPEVPQTLLDQLKTGGSLIVPEGEYFQMLRLYTKTERGITRRDLLPVRFVPMVHPED